jgi:hypothetical protein
MDQQITSFEIVSPALSIFLLCEAERYSPISDPQKVVIWLVAANIPVSTLVI